MIEAMQFVFFACIALAHFVMFVMGAIVGHLAEQDLRARRDLADAELMRENLRKYEARIAEFAPSSVRHGQSLCAHGRLPEALTTPLAPLASSAHRVSRGIPLSP